MVGGGGGGELPPHGENANLSLPAVAYASTVTQRGSTVMPEPATHDRSQEVQCQVLLLPS